MDEAQFYQPGEPEYNKNDPLKPRVIQDPTKDVKLTTQTFRQTTAGLRSRMEKIAEGVKQIQSGYGDATPTFELHEVFPESDLKVENYMVDVHLPEEDVVPDYADGKSDAMEELDPLSETYADRMTELETTLKAMRTRRRRALWEEINKRETQLIALRRLLEKLGD